MKGVDDWSFDRLAIVVALTILFSGMAMGCALATLGFVIFGKGGG